MSEQLSEAVNPGQAIYDALSAEAKAAVDALPDDVFLGEGGLDAAKRFVESVRMADAINAERWLINPDSRTGGRHILSLIVSGTRLIHVRHRQYIVVRYDDDVLDESPREWISDRHLQTEAVLKTWPNLHRVHMPFSDISEAPAGLWSGHEAAARVLNQPDWVFGRSSGDDWHKDAWRIKLGLISGEALPAPTFMPPDRYGLTALGDPDPPLIPDEATRELLSAEANAEVDASSVDHTVSRRHLQSYFSSAGLTYTDEQIAAFYTSLQTKGFVILSGISGTGKSKIAQRFSELLPEVLPRNEPELSEGFIRIAVKPYMRKYKRIRLWKEVAAALPVPAPGKSIVVPFSVNGAWGKCRVWNRPETDVDVYLFPQGEVGEQFRDRIDGSFAVRFTANEKLDRIESIELLTELPIQSNTPEGADSASSHLFLPVRPDWRDGKALIGYHNPLSGEYVRTPFLEFVIAAADDYRAGNRNAFFVILDEMNLAHVEYYFADVLSVIESGRDDDGWTVEGIPLAVGEEDADLPESMKLPPNLYIVGTVNMDETTHPFSPKVLDRAFTIELTEVDFSDYPPELAESTELEDVEKQALLDAFTRQGRYPRIDKREIAELVDRHPKFRDDLQSLNSSLRRSRMHFGYRVFDEIMQFVFNAELNVLFTAEDAFDHAVLMKVLPKFNGSRGKLQTALFDLIHWCRMSGTLEPGDRADLEARFSKLIDEGQPFDSVVTDAVDTVEDNWRYPATGRRVALMMQDLYTEGFASFG